MVFVNRSLESTRRVMLRSYLWSYFCFSCCCVSGFDLWGPGNLTRFFIPNLSLWTILSFLVLYLSSDSIAYSAMATTLVGVSIIFCKLMSVYAMSLFRMDSRRRRTSESIFFWSYSFKMRRVHAFSVIAKMIYLHSLSYFSFRYHVSDAMGKPTLSSESESSIGLCFAASANPIPTGNRINMMFNFTPEFFHFSIVPQGEN